MQKKQPRKKNERSKTARIVLILTVPKCPPSCRTACLHEAQEQRTLASHNLLSTDWFDPIACSDQNRSVWLSSTARWAAHSRAWYHDVLFVEHECMQRLQQAASQSSSRPSHRVVHDSVIEQSHTSLYRRARESCRIHCATPSLQTMQRRPSDSAVTATGPRDDTTFAYIGRPCRASSPLWWRLASLIVDVSPQTLWRTIPCRDGDGSLDNFQLAIMRNDFPWSRSSCDRERSE